MLKPYSNVHAIMFSTNLCMYVFVHMLGHMYVHVHMCLCILILTLKEKIFTVETYTLLR